MSIPDVGSTKLIEIQSRTKEEFINKSLQHNNKEKHGVRGKRGLNMVLPK